MNLSSARVNGNTVQIAGQAPVGLEEGIPHKEITIGVRPENIQRAGQRPPMMT